MKYQGGKARPGKSISEILVPALRVGTGHYVEPFVGAASVARHVVPHAVAARMTDRHEDLILMWKALDRGWEPPMSVTEEQWNQLRYAAPSPDRAFAGFACSWGGKWFRGYARDRSGTNFATQGRKSLLTKIADIQNASRYHFAHCDYTGTNIYLGDVVYCDPPYAGTEGYSVGKFDHAAFWSWAAECTDRAHAFVFVSEFNAPPGWVPVWSAPRNRAMHGDNQYTDRPLRDKDKAAALDQLFCKPVVAEILGLTVCDDSA
jgi:DNA adenine methylase